MFYRNIRQTERAIFRFSCLFLIKPTETTGCSIDIPRGANQLYLSGLDMQKDKREIELFEKYASGDTLTDQKYGGIIELSFIPVSRKRSLTTGDFNSDLHRRFGLEYHNDNGRQYFSLKEESVSEIKADTWDCIVISLLHDRAFEVIECFDFNQRYKTEEKLGFDLGTYRFLSDNAEQKLSNALHTAFFFTLAGYKFGLRADQYDCFEDYFDNEFYKRVSLIYAIWNSGTYDDDIRHIPLYDSFRACSRN